MLLLLLWYHHLSSDGSCTLVAQAFLAWDLHRLDNSPSLISHMAFAIRATNGCTLVFAFALAISRASTSLLFVVLLHSPPPLASWLRAVEMERLVSGFFLFLGLFPPTLMIRYLTTLDALTTHQNMQYNKLPPFLSSTVGTRFTDRLSYLITSFSFACTFSDSGVGGGGVLFCWGEEVELAAGAEGVGGWGFLLLSLFSFSVCSSLARKPKWKWKC